MKKTLQRNQIQKPNHSISDSIKKDDIINTKLSDSSKLPSKNSNTHLIKSPDLKQDTNPTSSLEQNTISASGAMENESIPQNIPKIKKNSV